MKELILYLLFALFFAVSMFGWGALITDRTLFRRYISLSVAIGMAITVFVGGWLNVVGLAFGWMLNAWLFIGVLLGAGQIVRLDLVRRTVVNRAFLFSVFAFFSLLILMVVWQLMPAFYNIGDDYQKYFVHPVKMLTTGSMFGSPLAALGKEVFGGQGFYQAFFINALGLKSINVFDAVFCSMLCVGFLLERGLAKGAVAVAVLCSILMVVIDAHYVNTSAIYSGAVFMMASIVVIEAWFRADGVGAITGRMLGVSLGLLLAALISVKTSFGVFAIALFVPLLVLIAVNASLRQQFVFWLLVPAALTVVFILPWLFQAFDNFEWIRFARLGGSGRISEQGFSSFLFSFGRADYGVPAIYYTAMVLALLLCALAALVIPLWRQAVTIPLVLVVTISFIYVGLLALLGPNTLPYGTILRYLVPFFIGVVPLVLLLFYEQSPWRGRSRCLALFCALGAGCALPFVPHAVAGVKQVVTCGAALAFSQYACHPAHRSYASGVLNTSPDDGQSAQGLLSAWQSHVPEGESIVLWVSTPFYADFVRNEIYEVDAAGVSNHWAHVPLGARYFVIEHTGFATLSMRMWMDSAANSADYDSAIANRVLRFRSGLMRADKEVLFQDARVVVFKLNQAFDLPVLLEPQG